MISHTMTMLSVHETQWKSVSELTASLPQTSLFTHSCTVKMASIRLHVIDYRDPDVKVNIENMFRC
jgi:hypothetical protein